MQTLLNSCDFLLLALANGITEIPFGCCPLAFCAGMDFTKSSKKIRPIAFQNKKLYLS